MTDGTNAIQHQEQPTNPGDQQPPAQGQQPPIPEQSDDPDELAVREAVAAVQAEDTSATDQTNGQQQEGQQQAAQNQIMIPKQRLDEVLAAQRQAEQHAAYWRGMAEARQQPGQPGQPAQQQPQATPEQQIAALDQQLDDLSIKFDNVEITMVEFKRQERELERQLDAVRTASQPAPQQPRQTNDDLFLESKTAQLEQTHPWVKVFEVVGTDAHWGLLKAEAIDNLTKQGIDPRQGNWGRLQLRAEIARLADEYGPSLVAERANAQGIALPGQSQEQPQQNQQPQMSPAAKARQAKLQMQEGAPPDLSALRGGAGDSGVVTEAQIERMSEDEIDALPMATRQKLLGISA